MRDIALSGRQYTWAGRRDKPTYEKLDVVLVSVEWKQKLPLVSVAGSDHIPLILDSGEQGHLENKSKFSFKLRWIRQEGFVEVV